MSGSYEVRFLKESEHDSWDEMVTASPYGSVFHHAYWLGAAGLPFQILGCFDAGGELVGGMPLCYDRKVGLRFVRPPPLTPYQGVIIKATAGKYVRRLSRVKEVSQLLARRAARAGHFVYVRFPLHCQDGQPFIWEGFTPGVLYTYTLALNDMETVWRGMDSTKRTNIRRAEKDGIQVGPSCDFNDILGLVSRTYRRQGKSVQYDVVARAYDATLRAWGQSQGFVARARSGEAIAGVYIVWDERRAYYIMGGYDSACAHRGAWSLALWESVQHAARIGLLEYDFEGSTMPDVERAFRKFGARLIPRLTAVWCGPWLEPAWFAYEYWIRRKCDRERRQRRA